VRLASPDDLLSVLLDAEKGAARDVRLMRRTRRQFGPGSWSTSDDHWRARIVLD
jgi:hypothetical protein